MKRILVMLVGLAVLAAAGGSFGVSDGHYDYARQHCRGSDNASDKPKYTNPSCHSLWVSLSDYSGHEYLGVGPRQTADGTAPNTVDVWIDMGRGAQTRYWFDRAGRHGPKYVKGTPAKPFTGLRVYFGADDQLDPEGFGEHDSSEHVAKGPSDGGGIEFNVSPASVKTWLASLSALSAFLADPVPVVSAGLGSCADGLCVSLTTARRVAFQGGDPTKHRDVFNYAGVEWDPYNCAGPDDSVADCSTPAHPDWDLGDWYDTVGTTYVEPGFQFFEDPDPEGSPGVLGLIGIPRDDPYPLPALYVGSCGVVIGGGPAMQVPKSSNTNSAGQFVLLNACR
jgi:hypothetical protein